MVSVLFLQPPSPPRLDVTRDYAGGFGVAVPVSRRGYGHGQFSIPYSSLMYSAGVLRELHHDISYIDAQAERLNAQSCVARVLKVKPDLIVAVTNLPTIRGDSHLFQKLKRASPRSRLVCIGTVCRVLPDELASSGAADMIVLGEQEAVLPDLVGAIGDGSDIHKVPGIGIVREGDLVRTEVSTDQVDLSELPWPPHDLMPIERYRDPHFGSHLRFFPVWASRGCPMPCAFYCPYPVGMGKKTRLRPVDDFVKEVASLNREYGVKAFTFRDQIFTSKLDRAEEICDRIIERGLKIRWICETRFDRISERLLCKMERAGCSEIHFGLETGDPDLLHTIGKPGMEIATVRETIRLTKKVGISPLVQIILGLPGESEETVQNTLSLLKKLEIGDLSVNIATPYPGTPLFTYAKEHGLLVTEDWSRYTSFEGVMRSESMSVSELEESRRLIIEEVLASAPLLESFRRLCRRRQVIDVLSKKLALAYKRPLSFLEYLSRLILKGQKKQI